MGRDPSEGGAGVIGRPARSSRVKPPLGDSEAVPQAPPLTCRSRPSNLPSECSAGGRGQVQSGGCGRVLAREWQARAGAVGSAPRASRLSRAVPGLPGWWRRWGGRAGAGRPGGRGGATLKPSVPLPWPPPAPCAAPSPPGRAPGPRTDGPWRRPPPASPCSPPPRSRWPPGPRPAPALAPDPVSERAPRRRLSLAEPARGANSLAPAWWGSFSSPSATPLGLGGPSPQAPPRRPRPAPSLPQYLRPFPQAPLRRPSDEAALLLRTRDAPGRRPLCLSASDPSSGSSATPPPRAGRSPLSGPETPSGSSATRPRAGRSPLSGPRTPSPVPWGDSPRLGTLPRPHPKPLSDTPGQDALRQPHSDAPRPLSLPRPRAPRLPAPQRVPRGDESRSLAPLPGSAPC